MTRGQRRRRLSFSWWQQLLLTLLPLLLVTWLFGKSEPKLTMSWSMRCSIWARKGFGC